MRRSGERAWLLLNLDEPTNHFDTDSRRALLDAPNNYQKAVTLIMHDCSLMELMADRLWLAADGTVTPFEGEHGRLCPLRAGPRQGRVRADPDALGQRQTGEESRVV